MSSTRGFVIEGSQNTMSSPRSRHLYGVHFPETQTPNHPGYLLIRPLKAGFFGDTMLVLSIHDDKVYVRKIDREAGIKLEPGIKANEVRNYIAYPNVPRLISWLEFEEGVSNMAVYKTATIWEFCNGGDLKSLVRRCGLEFPQNLADQGHPNIRARIPEILIWRMFDTLLSVLTTIHQQGITHSDLHDGNVFFHYPTPTSNLPSVFLGDFGISNEYSGVHHQANPTTSTVPFQIDQLDPDICPAGSPVWIWYQTWTRDLEQLADLLNHTIESSPSTGRNDDDQDIHYAVARGRGHKGYSIELCQRVIDLDVFARTHRNSILLNQPGAFQPATAMQQQEAFKDNIHTAATRVEHCFANSAHPEINFVRLTRPPIPNSDPATWPTRDSVHISNPTNGAATINHLDQGWQINLDHGSFEVKRIDQLGHEGRWGVLEPGYFTDSDDNDDANGNDEEGNKTNTDTHNQSTQDQTQDQAYQPETYQQQTQQFEQLRQLHQQHQQQQQQQQQTPPSHVPDPGIETNTRTSADDINDLERIFHGMRLS